MDIWSVLIVVFFFQGIFVLTSILLSKKRRSKLWNIYLVLIVVVLSWILEEFLLIRQKIDIGIPTFYGTRYGVWFLMGPLVYFYFGSIIRSKKRFSYIDFTHFLPFLIFVVLLPLIFGDPLNKRQIDYGMLSVFDHREKVIAPLQYLYSYIFIVQFIHFGGYLFVSLYQVNQYRKQLKANYSYDPKKIRWLRMFLNTFITILCFASLFLFLLLKTDIYRRHMDYIYVLPIGFLLYLIGYFLIDTDWPNVDKKNVKYASSSLNKENLPNYITKLEDLMQKEAIYLDPSIRLKDMAEKMGISAHHLSQLINQYYQVSFFDFINKHRIEAAKKMIQQDPKRLFIEVAFDSGFNNKTSFVNSFKKFEKTTPSAYRKQWDNS